MGKSSETLTAERLRTLLDYNPETGQFRWRTGRRSGLIAGCIHADERRVRWQIVVDGRHYKAHRLAWLYVYGYWPNLVDHINRDGLDNSIANLREASEVQNKFNSVYPKGETGYRGVSFYKNRYMAQISHNGKSFYIGRYKTAEEAYAAWCRKAEELRGEFVRTD
jgi:HNH endonuclease/AP2 domain